MKTIKKGLILDRAGVDAVSQETAAWLADRAADGHDNEMTVWTDTLLARMGLSPSWHYRSGRNTLQIIFMAAMIGVLLV